MRKGIGMIKFLHCRVCRQMAPTVSPAFTSMILSEGVVGFGGPLQAMLAPLTSLCGYIALC